MLTSTIPAQVLELLNAGAGEARQENRAGARAYFLQALELDPDNETALLWMAHLVENPYKAVEYLQVLLSRKPNNPQARAYLAQAEARCAELDQLVSSSSTLSTWNHFKQGNTRHSGRGVPLLGQYLLRQGMITPQQLEMAVRRHEDLEQRGLPKQIGQVMIELGYLTQAQLDAWLQQQSGDFSIRFRD